MNSTPSSDRDILVALLRALQQPEQAAALPGSDARIIAVARYHRLSALLSVSCAGTLSHSLGESFRRDRVLATARGMLLEQAAEECIRALADVGAPSIVLKGLDYEHRLYGTGGLRPTGDVDLLVPNHHRRAAFLVLDRLGFEPRAAAPGFDDPDYHEVAWRRRDVEIDLHFGLAPTVRCRIDYAAIWSERESFRVGDAEAAVLARPHAAAFHALHMTIDHFAVPAIYLVDLARLIPDTETLDQVRQIAAIWNCQRPLATALSLAAAFLPDWGRVIAPTSSGIARRIAGRFGTTDPLSRPEQLFRKLAHFDNAGQGARYLAVQAVRNVREWFEAEIRRRPARERLDLGPGLRPRRDRD